MDKRALVGIVIGVTSVLGIAVCGHMYRSNQSVNGEVLNEPTNDAYGNVSADGLQGTNQLEMDRQ